jgi:nitrogen fixation protein FixH
MTQQKNSSKIPYIFFAFFAVIFAVNFFYIYVSQKSWRGVAVEDSYKKGVNYNNALELVAKQKELGWKMEIKYSPTLSKSGVVTIRLLDKNSRQINDANLYINFKRPTQEGFDFAQEIKNFAGIYKAEIAFPLKGQWDFEVVATKNENTFQEVKRYVIQ